MQTEFTEEFRQIGIEIGYIRRQKGMSQAQLAESAGLSSHYLAEIEAPAVAATPSLDALFRIARALGVPITALFKTIS